MNSRKDIFTAFQEGSEQLRLQPSPQAWQKLESRLEAKPQQSGKVVSMRWLMAIAAALVLVFGVFFIQKNLNQNSLAVGSEPHPYNLQDLVNTDGCNPYCLLIKERKSLPDHYANPVRQ